ncbi:type II secretion system F family protein [Ignatzschineria rhizosphaerae]|uniref:Type II secretion system F family protein n=1 Tax=Ignatzschineria rhizosphaerae TaxID=2923279 RepID=A0ABY3X2L3_9GAMM|nr:type II secretion system F family protein [Ignatzschineria rhizosphaerae]UNM96500.1 type II secretion system F family protein [Ignatzschineria rhizosphaerae]
MVKNAVREVNPSLWENRLLLLLGNNKVGLGVGIRLKREERLFFTEQISLLLAAGVPITKALDLLLHSAKKRSLSLFLQKLKEAVISGAPISSVLTLYPRSFSQLYIALIEVGEAAGRLPEIFDYLASIERRRLVTLKAIRKALIYPLMVIVVAMAVLVFILVAVVPTFEGLYQSSGVELPEITQKIINLSHFLLSHGSWVLFYTILLLWIIRKVLQREGLLRKKLDYLIIKSPLVGRLLLANFNAGFSQIISVMIDSGIPLIKSLQLYEGGVSNLYLRKQLRLLRSSLEQGQSFYIAAQDRPIFTDVTLTLISVGEVSGTLIKVLERSGEYHADQVEERVDAFVALIDPLSLLFIGLIVGVILIALYLPMFNMGMVI